MNQPYPPDPRMPGYASEPVPGPNDDTVESVHAWTANQESQHQNERDPASNQVEERVDVYEDKHLRRATLRSWMAGIIYFLLGVLEVILGLRFVFRLLGANQGNSFTLALYDFSHLFVGPFHGIFTDQAIGTTSVFELSTLISMLIYALIGWGLVALSRVIFAPVYGSGQQVSTTWRRQR